MREFWEANKYLLLVAVLALIAGTAIGLTIGLAVESPAESSETGSIGVASVLPDTRIERVVTFTRCAHTMTVSVESNGFVGYTKEELAAFYADYEIERFDRELVTITQLVDGCCPEHLLLREDGDDALCVYRTDATFFSEELMRALPFDRLSALPEETRTSLREGIVFDSLPDIDAYLEGIES